MATRMLTRDDELFTDVIAGALHYALVPEQARIKTLESEIESARARIAELEARPGLADAYKGVWRQDTRYTTGAMVTHSGSLWVARLASVSRRPGAGDGSWVLAVKRGKDCECPHCRGEATEAQS